MNELKKFYYNTITNLSPEQADKLKLYPTTGIVSRLNHNYALKSIKAGNRLDTFDFSFEVKDVIAIENCIVGTTVDTNEADFDIKLSDGKQTIYLDFTSDANLLLEKATRMKSKFKVASSYLYVPHFIVSDNEFIAYLLNAPPEFALSIEYMFVNEDDKFIVDTQLTEYYDRVITSIASMVESAEYKSSRVNPLDASHAESFAKALKSNSSDTLTRFVKNAPALDVTTGILVNSLIKKYNTVKQKKLHHVSPSDIAKVDIPFYCRFNELKEGDIFEMTDNMGISVLNSSPVNFLSEQKELIEATYGIGKKISERNMLLYIGDRLSDENLAAILSGNKSAENIFESKNDAISDLSEYERLLAKRVSRCVEVSPLYLKYKLVSDTCIVKILPKLKEFNDILSDFTRSIAFQSVEHQYEIAKTVLASMQKSPGDNEYFIGRNGEYNSFTIVRNNCTVDSFKTVHYKVIYKTKGKLTQTKWISYNKNTLVWALKLPFVVLSVVTWFLEYTIDEGVDERSVMLTLSNLTELCCINRDPFAQVAELYRYYYQAAIGYNDDFTKLAEKFNDYYPRSTTELHYVLSMLKNSSYLKLLRDSNNLSVTVNSGNIEVCHPHSFVAINSFNHDVSSFYICNIYNKFRAFHEVSDAVCYLSLLEENNIYKSLENNIIANASRSLSELEDIDSLVNRTMDFIAVTSGRFTGDSMFILAASVSKRSAVANLIHGADDLDIREMFSVKGSTSGTKPSVEKQGIRAASALLEKILEMLSFNSINEADNMLLRYSRLAIQQKGFNFRLLITMLLLSSDEEFMYRVVQKDQKGHREISVLNAVMRLCTKYVENLHKNISKAFPENKLNDINKDMSFQAMVADHSKDLSKFIIYDNADQSRWGPNALMHIFAVFSSGILQESHENVLSLYCLIQMTKKIAKYPESLIDYFKKDVSFTKDSSVKRFLDATKSDMSASVFGQQFKWGMCQGILHEFSSNYHALKVSVETAILSKLKSYESTDVMVTSDDAFRVLVGNSSILRNQYLDINSKVNTLFNIVRNTKKSVLSSYIAEFNSIFINKGILAMPTLKFRFSKIDCGAGTDPIEDQMLSVSSSGQYITNGGSYFGSVIIGVLNLTLYCEQWRKFKHTKLLSNPVEFLGLAIIEPLTTIINGPLSNSYLRFKASTGMGNNEYFKMVSTAIVQADVLDLAPLNRGDPYSTSEITQFFSPSLIGLINNIRTKSKASRLAKRQKLKYWKLEDNLFEIVKEVNDVTSLVNSFYEYYRTNPVDEALQENSFYIRFSEPWMALDKECFSSNSSFSIMELPPKFSLRKLEEVALTFDRAVLQRKIIAMENSVHFSDIGAKLKSYMMALSASADEIQAAIFKSTGVVKIVNPISKVIKFNTAHVISEPQEVTRMILYEKLVGTSRAISTRGFTKYTEEKYLPSMSSNYKAWFLACSIQNKLASYSKSSVKTVFYGDERATISDYAKTLLEMKYGETVGLSNVDLVLAESLRELSMLSSTVLKESIATKTSEVSSHVYDILQDKYKPFVAKNSKDAKIIRELIKTGFCTASRSDAAVIELPKSIYRAQVPLELLAGLHYDVSAPKELLTAILSNKNGMNFWINFNSATAIKKNSKFISDMFARSNVVGVITTEVNNVYQHDIISDGKWDGKLDVPADPQASYLYKTLVASKTKLKNKDIVRHFDVNKISAWHVVMSEMNSTIFLESSEVKNLRLPVSTFKVELKNIPTAKASKIKLSVTSEDMSKRISLIFTSDKLDEIKKLIRLSSTSNVNDQIDAINKIVSSLVDSKMNKFKFKVNKLKTPRDLDYFKIAFLSALTSSSSKIGMSLAMVSTNLARKVNSFSTPLYDEMWVKSEVISEVLMDIEEKAPANNNNNNSERDKEIKERIYSENPVLAELDKFFMENASLIVDPFDEIEAEAEENDPMFEALRKFLLPAEAEVKLERTYTLEDLENKSFTVNQHVKLDAHKKYLYTIRELVLSVLESTIQRKSLRALTSFATEHIEFILDKIREVLGNNVEMCYIFYICDM